MIKRILAFVFVLLCVACMDKAFAEPPEITAKAAVVIEASTGRILYAKDAKEQHYPASTTKIMTLIVALENANGDAIVTASENSANTEGSSLGLLAGEKIKMLDLSYGMMLVSGNYATVAIAEHIAGSVEAFSKLMTDKAHEIGAVDTNFMNTSGLPDPKHYSTAYDLAIITAYGYKNPKFAEIVSTKQKKIPSANKDHERDLDNENRMLYLFDGANGVKTGYTQAAGRCLVSGAKRDNIQLIAVVLDCDHMWEDSTVLLDYAFQQVKGVTVFKQGDVLKTVKVLNGKSDSIKLVAQNELVVPIFETETLEVSTVLDAPDRAETPITAGQKLGVVNVMYKDQIIGKVDLVAEETVERKTFFGLLLGTVWNFFTYMMQNFA